MYSLSAVSGVESSSFWEHWNLIRSRLDELLNLGNKIRTQWDRVKAMREEATEALDIKVLDDKLFMWSNMYQTWKEVEEKIVSWKLTWERVEKSIGGLIDTGTLGIVPLILPAWALGTLTAGGLAALTFVSMHGLSLLKQYQLEKSVIDRLEKGSITSIQASNIFESIKTEPIFGNLSSMTTGALVGALALVGFLWYQR